MNAINWLEAVADTVRDKMPDLWVERHSQVVCFAIGDRGAVLYVVDASGMIATSIRSRGGFSYKSVEHGIIEAIPVLESTVPEAARHIVCHLRSNVVRFPDALSRHERRQAR
jgi:hypothetical protein